MFPRGDILTYYNNVLLFFFLHRWSQTYLCETKWHAYVLFPEYITLENKFQENFVSVMNILLI